MTTFTPENYTPAGSPENITDEHREFWLQLPTQFLYHELGVHLWSKQADIIRAIRRHRRVAVRSCNGSGKTFAAACTVIWWLMSHPTAIAVTTAPTDRQVRELLWREIRGLYNRNSALIEGTLSRTSLELSHGHFAIGLSTDVPEQFQGFHSGNILFVVDEASGVSEDIYEAVEGSMTTGQARLLLIGNPTRRSGTFYEAFHARRSLWHNIHISALDTPNLTLGDESQNASITEAIPGLPTPDWVEEAAKNWGPKSPLYQIRVLGEFPSHGTDTLIGLEYLEGAAERSSHGPDLAQPAQSETGENAIQRSGPLPVNPGIEANQNADDPALKPPLPLRERAGVRGYSHDSQNPSDEPITLGVDVARFGEDRTAICIRQGQHVLSINTHERNNTMTTAGIIANLIRELEPIAVNIDEIGVGAGVVDRLKEQDFECVNGINVSAKSSDPERYANLRAELYDALRKRFESEQITIPQDRDLIGELASIKYSFASTGALLIQSKNELRRHGLPSPDRADALTFAFVPKPEPEPFQIFTGFESDPIERDPEFLSLTISQRRRILARRE